ncbi:MAG: 4Fe-4S binding protein [Candidatus Krumholzibacteria bacterium]|nr:4Fe-4S binding protein [Candidatus Krumholzibacteria bacterium]
MVKIPDIKAFEKLRKKLEGEKDLNRKSICVCGGSACIATGSLGLIDLFEKELKKHGIDDEVDILVTGCHGFCEKGPLVVIRPEGIFYPLVKKENVPDIVTESVIEGKAIEALLYTDPMTDKKIVYEHDVPFYKKQKRLVLGNNGLIDPMVITDYIRVGGYKAFASVVDSMTPDKVIEMVIDSGLKGRGGGGFPTGVKWKLCKNAKGKTKNIVCNADEGDPGAYMDRSILEGNPHSVIEGMLIGGFAITASTGYIYVRTEYPLAIHRLKQAIKQAKGLGFIGKNILGTKFSFDIEIREGSGAFVCGEETSLMHSIEGLSPEPSQRPPFPTESGLWGNPTNINNVETWAVIPLIVNKGSKYFSSIGTENSKGTKIFSLVGKINNSGLVEVPMGISMGEIINGIGGGIPDGKAFKAVQTGGPSGGCIPAALMDIPVDYEKLAEVGSIMGSGGMVVMDEDTCVVDIAKYFLSFTNDESCGKCTSCRDGSKMMLNILTRISEGHGKPEDIDLLLELGEAIKDASQCGLGQTLPNPVLSTIRYFREEYNAHIVDKRCPAHVCKELVNYSIDPEACIGCGVCLKNCSVGAITGKIKEAHLIDPDKCTKCGVCREVCKFNAVIVE